MPGAESGTEPGIVFSQDILPVIQASFVPLLTEDTGLDAGSWEGLMRGSDQGEVIIPFDADRSLLIEQAERAGPDGPSGEDIARVRQWIEEGARNDAGEIPYADADRLLYVCNQGSAVISVIDMEAHVVIRTVDLRGLGFSENAQPHHVAVAPDGLHWYLSLIGENTVLKFDRANVLVDRFSFEAPGMLALDPTGERLYVGRSMSAVNPPQRIGVANSDDMTLEEADVLYPRPHALVASPDGRHVFSASLGENRMATVDAVSLETEIIDLPGPLHSLVQFAVTPNGQSMIVGGHMSGDLMFLDLTDPLNPEIVETVHLGGAPWHPSFLPDGSRAVVPRKQAGAVSIVDMASRSHVGEVSGPGIAQPHGSAVRQDGRYAYVSNNNLNGAFTPRYPHDGEPNGTIVVIDPETLEVVKVIEVEQYPTGIGTRPAS